MPPRESQDSGGAFVLDTQRDRIVPAGEAPPPPAAREESNEAADAAPSARAAKPPKGKE